MKKLLLGVILLTSTICLAQKKGEIFKARDEILKAEISRKKNGYSYTGGCFFYYVKEKTLNNGIGFVFNENDYYLIENSKVYINKNDRFKNNENLKTDIDAIIYDINSALTRKFDGKEIFSYIRFGYVNGRMVLLDNSQLIILIEFDAPNDYGKMVKHSLMITLHLTKENENPEISIL